MQNKFKKTYKNKDGASGFVCTVFFIVFCGVFTFTAYLGGAF